MSLDGEPGPRQGLLLLAVHGELEGFAAPAREAQEGMVAAAEELAKEEGSGAEEK